MWGTSSHFPIYLIIYIVFVVVLLTAYFLYGRAKRKKIREGIYGGKFVPAKEFEKSWIVGASRKHHGITGFKYEDSPGCYVILIFDHEVEGDDWDGYDDVYVGQSVNICARVHSHLNGHGNGDVYADMRNGKHVYLRFIPCDEKEMNELEKSLIDAFDATSSYNNTRGGAKKR